MMRALGIAAAAASLLAPAAGLAQEPEYWEDGFEDAQFDEAGQAEIFAGAAFRHYAAAFGELCYWGEEIEAAKAYPAARWTLTWDDAFMDAPQTATLYRFHCDSGAYNVNHVWYLQRADSAPEPLAFARPAIDVAYEDDDSGGAVREVAVLGFAASAMLVNSRFDPQTQSIVETSYWRGLGDASSQGTWRFQDGGFVLTRYEVDASYDGEINPAVIVAY